MRRYISDEIREFVRKPHFDRETLLKKDSSYPKISIITPSYNQAEFLERTILSVLNQNYPNLEYIIIDGGSTDGSVDIIKKYERYLAYWISEKDSGMYEAINKGLKIASGNILAYLNSDDLYFPDTFQTVVDYLQKHSATYLIYGNCDYIDADEALLYSYRYPNFNWKRFVAFKWSSIPQPASFWRSAVHLEIGYFDPTFKMAGDFEFFIRVGQYFKIDHLSKTLAMVRLHKKSLISLHQDKNRKEIYIIHQRYGVSPGIVTISRRWIVELQFKLLNLPLMIKKSIWKLWHLCRLFAK